MNLVPQVETVVRESMSGQQAGHGFDHVARVHRLSIEIQSQTGGDRQVVELAALLHDIGDAKFHAGVERSGERSRKILLDAGADREVIDHVVHIVENLSFRKRDSAEALSLEGQVVQDADRIDALGAIGIVRTIEYGAAIDQPFHVADNQDGQIKTGLSHFDDKLFRLPALLNTEPARELAATRVKFMRTFVDQFLDEFGE